MKPIPESERRDYLDLARGVALLGTFYLAAIARGFPHAAFFNLRSPDNNNALDWGVAYLGELFLDHKAIALLSLLYGAGVLRFAQRLNAADQRARWPGLRRAIVLLLIGVPVGMHGLIWEGIPLWFFGLFTPALLFLRRRGDRVLIALTTLAIVLAMLSAVDAQGLYNSVGTELGQYWVTGAYGSGDEAGSHVFFGTVFLLMGSMTLGLLADRRGYFDPTPEQAKRFVRFGLGVGVPLAIASMVWRELGDYGDDVAIIGEAPNIAAALPMAFAYIGLLSMLRRQGTAGRVRRSVQDFGRLALSNSIIQTVLGLVVLRDGLFDRATFSRSELAGLFIVVAAAQLAGSSMWLRRFQFGPAEWLVRSITYRQRLPMRRDDAPRATVATVQ